MKTVKQVSRLTGISVRTLQYYDDALETLQQILLFKELDFPLKDIGAIMRNPGYDKDQAFLRQKKLLEAKRDRLNGLLNLLDRLMKGEKIMSFKEFDLSEYFGLLKEFRENHSDDIVKIWGGLDQFDQTVDKIKENEEKTAKAAIQYYGSIEKYTEAMKEQLNELPKKAQVWNEYRNEDYMKKVSELMKKVTSDLKKDVSSNEIQCLVGEWVKMGRLSDLDDRYRRILTEGYLSDSALIEANDKMYGKGASVFIGEALKAYWNY